MTEEEKKVLMASLKKQNAQPSTVTSTSAPNSQKIAVTTNSNLNPSYQAKSYDAGMLGMDNPNNYLDSNALTMKTIYERTLAGLNGGNTAPSGSRSYGIGSVKAFTPSAQYQQEMIHANNILDALKSGRTAYTDQLNGIINQIQNRKPFQYDMNSDTMFQNSLQSAMGKGQMAMQDTMGQAAALTGGYGSTYATSAGNQAYNSFIQDAYANLPDYYNMAMQAYNLEGQRLADQASLLQSADESWYNRIANAYQAQADKVNNMYNQEYQNYWQTQSANQSAAQFNAEMAYKQSRDAISDLQSAIKSSSSSSGTNAKGYKISDFGDDIKRIVEQNGVVDAFGNLVPETENYLNKLAETYGFDADELGYVARSFANPKYSLGKDNQYYDQWGNPYTKNVGLRLVERDSKGEKDKNGNPISSDNDIYEDDFGNRYTLAQLKARNMPGLY